jgi:hypothetical protein
MRFPTFSNDGQSGAISSSEDAPAQSRDLKNTPRRQLIRPEFGGPRLAGSKAALKRIGKLGHLIDRQPPDQHITATRPRP